jgi:hypothetical protein
VDWAGDKNTCCSTLGYCFLFVEGVLLGNVINLGHPKAIINSIIFNKT